MNNYAFFPSSEWLREYVLCYMIMDNDFSCLTREVGIDVYPNGLSGISITFGDAYGYEKADGQRDRFGTGAVAIGLHNQMFRLIPSRFQKHFIIAFRPGVLPKFLKVPMNEIHNQLADLSCFIRYPEELPERMSLAGSVAGCVAVVEEWLSETLGAVKLYNDITNYVISDIICSEGSVKIESICKKYSVNKKYIERKFKESIGITPKQYAEVVKLNTLIDVLIEAREKSWPELSAEAGFIDYSHLSKHTSKLLDQSPIMLRQKLYLSYSNGLMTHTDGLLSSLCILDAH